MTRFFLRLACAAGLICIASHASAEDYTGRGVFPFASSTGCPVPSQPACNRIALDDADTHATLDTATHQIRFANARSYDKKTMVGDVVLHGHGTAADGRVVPLSLHVFVYKDDDTWKISAHAHAPVRGKFSQIVLEPYTLMVMDGGTAKAILTPDEGVKVIADPSFAAEMARVFVQLRDNRGEPDAAPDLTIALGLGKVAKSVVRVQLQMDAPAPDQSLEQQLQHGTWALRLQPKSSHVPRDTVARDLFLFGLEQLPVLQDVVANGFKHKLPMVMGADKGNGYVIVGETRVAYPNAAESALAFLQNSFMGEIVAYQQQTRAAHGH